MAIVGEIGKETRGKKTQKYLVVCFRVLQLKHAKVPKGPCGERSLGEKIDSGTAKSVGSIQQTASFLKEGKSIVKGVKRGK